MFGNRYSAHCVLAKILYRLNCAYDTVYSRHHVPCTMSLLKRLYKSVIGSRYLTSGSIVLVGFFIVNVLNYAFTLIISRLLGVSAFGEVTALISLSVLVSVPSAALTMLMAREVSFHRASEEHYLVPSLVSFMRRNVLVAAIGLWIFGLILVPIAQNILHIGIWPLFIFSLLIPFSLLQSIQSGTFQGMQNFFGLSGQNIISAAVKFFGSIAFVLLGLSVAGVSTALVLGSALSFLYGFLVLHRYFKKVTTPEVISSKDFRSRVRNTLPSILATTLFLGLLNNIDVLLAKHYLSPIDAGYYGALATVGTIVVYGIGAFVTVLLPMAAESHARKDQSNNVLGLSLLVITAISLLTVLVFSLVPNLIVDIIFGSRYLAVAPYLGRYSLAMFFVTLSIVFTNYAVATRNSSFLYFFTGGIIFETLLIIRFHSTIGQIVLMVILSTGLLAFMLGLNYIAFSGIVKKS
jgi:O-antigen/teichoic acid export membrane protein